MSASSDVSMFNAILIQRFCQDTKYLLPLTQKQKMQSDKKKTMKLMVNVEAYGQTGFPASICIMKRLAALLPSPGWDVSLLRGLPPVFFLIALANNS